jgi:hypothetical protein
VARGSELGSQNPDVIVRDIEATRDRLAGTIDEIVDRTNPKNIARRTLDRVKGRFVNPDGSPRMETIAPVAGAVVGTVIVIVGVRRLVARS